MSKIIESLSLDGNTLPIKFIRYNPHSYKINNKTNSTTQNERHSKLIKTICTTVFNTPNSVKYLFMIQKMINLQFLMIQNTTKHLNNFILNKY